MKSMCSRVVDSVTLCLSLLMLLFGSCKNNEGTAKRMSAEEQAKEYQQKFNELVAEYETQGKDILAKSDSFFIFADGKAFWYKDLYSPDRQILVPNKDYKEFIHYLEFTQEGTPFVYQMISDLSLNESYFNKNTQDNIEAYEEYPYEKQSIRLYGNKGFIFKCKRYDPDEDNDYGMNYLIYFENPNQIFYLNTIPDSYSKDRLDFVETYASSLASKIISFEEEMKEHPFPYVFGYNRGEGGRFKLYYTINEFGEITQSDKIEYYNEIYTDIKFNFNISDFSTKGKAKDKLIFWIGKSIQDKEREKELEEIKTIINNSITLEQLSNETRNEVMFDEKYKNKEIYIRCRLDAIKNSYKYKYVVKSYAADLLGEWISDYNMNDYTNDSNFANLSYPKEVVMRVRVEYASNKNFDFENCQLIYVFAD